MDANWELMRDQLTDRVVRYAPFVADTWVKQSKLRGWQGYRLSRRRSIEFLQTFVPPRGSRYFDRSHRKNRSELIAAFEERVRAALLDEDRFPDKGAARASEVADIAIFVGYALVPSLIFLGRQDAAIEIADFTIERCFSLLSETTDAQAGSQFLYIVLFVPFWTLGLASMALAETGP